MKELDQETAKSIKGLELRIAQVEVTGIRLLIAYQCIECARIFDNLTDATLHMQNEHW